jgi:fluoroacetyl-CoA thioesterase
MALLAVGRFATLTFTVSAEDTALAIGSGDVPVLATPRLVAVAEAAAVAALAGELAAGESSVGTRVQLDHLVASPVGEQISVRAEVAHIDGRLLHFRVAAHRSDGCLVGQGEVTRVVVDRERFLARAQRASS